MLINSTQLKNNPVMNKNKTTVMANNLNTSSNINSSNNGVQKTQVSSTVGKAGLESIMGQKLMGPKISTIKR
jgi:hypothetical protein